MKTKIDTGFLDQVIQEIPDETSLPKGSAFFETYLIRPEPTNWFEMVLRFLFGIGPQQGFAIAADVRDYFDITKLLLTTVCQKKDELLIRVEITWEELGYNPQLFRKFLALVLYLHLVRIHPSRYGDRITLNF